MSLQNSQSIVTYFDVVNRRVYLPCSFIIRVRSYYCILLLIIIIIMVVPFIDY